ncbi:hypothetical protein NPN26_24625, partial [Vibrio parahaemolyticus]
LDNLIERPLGPNEHTVSDISPLEQSAITGKQDAVFGRGELGEPGVVDIPPAAHIQAHQPHELRQPTEVHVRYETRLAQRARPRSRP